ATVTGCQVAASGELLDRFPLECVTHQTSSGRDPELFHHVVFVKGDRSIRDSETAADLLHRITGSQYCEDFVLALAQFSRGGDFWRRAGTSVVILIENDPSSRQFLNDPPD